MNNDCLENRIIIATGTPYGKSAVAVIRISGGGCIALSQKFLSRKLVPNEIKLNKFSCGEFTENLMATCFTEKSYTGEESVELYPHGNPAICEKIIDALVKAGMRRATRGEFTKRAFLNGKLDLMQCEALADIIDAQTEEQLIYGNRRYDGADEQLRYIEKTLKNALSTTEAALHYSDELEDGEEDERIEADVYGKLDDIIQRLKFELGGYDGGRIIKDGFRVALVGKPNVGKSTLLNALVKSDRAIVTPIAGTTRDTVEGEYEFHGRKFIVTDTAGLTETTDAVEKIGVERAKRAAKEADAVIFLTLDGKPEYCENKKSITVINKCDGIDDVGTEYKKAETDGVLRISAKYDVNVNALRTKLYDLTPNNCGMICNVRQFDCIKRCLESCEAAKRESDTANGLEIVAAALYDAYSAISELFGESSVDEKVISDVFERFCVGK